MKIKYFCLALIPFLLDACVDDYEINFNKETNVLVVEGFLTDDYLNPDTIKIQYSNYVDLSVFIQPITSVKASIFELGTGKEIKLIEQKLGGYLPPKDFRINPSEKYVLRFKIPNGQAFESSIEQLTPTPPILKIYDKFNPQSRLSNDGKKLLSATEIYLDFQDTPNQKNFYLWRYIDNERLYYCNSCYNSRYNPINGKCDLKLFPYDTTPYYDYQCNGDCYSTIRSTKVNVMSDLFSEGKIIAGRLIAKIPFFSRDGCLIDNFLN